MAVDVGRPVDVRHQLRKCQIGDVDIFKDEIGGWGKALKQGGEIDEVERPARNFVMQIGDAVVVVNVERLYA
ncbi:MAG: hypothetical protein RR327_04485, partial [Clostridia bacterium]